MTQGKALTWCAMLIGAGLLLAMPARGQDQGANANNVVIILDSSGSMGNMMKDGRTRKIDAAKAALREVLGQVPMDTNIGLVVFGAANIPDRWVYPLGPRDDSKLMSAIALPQPDGNTPLGAYIKIAADRLLEQREKQHGYGTYRLIIVTDGEAQDQNLVDKYVPEVMARGITIDAVGVNMKSDHTLATKVHSYRRADDPRSLTKALSDVFAEVSGARSDAAADESFALIAPLPDEMASAMLAALSTSGNFPIGEKPEPKPEEAVTGGPAAGQTSPPAAGQPAPPSAKGGGSVKFYIIVAIMVLLVIYLRRGRKKPARSGSKSRGRRTR